MPLHARSLLGGAALASFAALAGALVAQHVFNMQPCPWCILQRLIFLLIGLCCTVSLVNAAALRRLLAAVSALLGGAGMAAAAYQHFVAAKSSSCDMTLADRIVSSTLHLDAALPAVFEVRASCADAAVNLLGVPFEFWSLALFAVLSLVGLRVLLHPR